MKYTITTRLVHLSAIGDTEITHNATVTLIADTNFQLPITITVTNADYTYDKITGIINLSNPKNNVVITAYATLTLDLTTLPNYEELDYGIHRVSIVAKANGFLDSEPSDPITFNKLESPYNEEIKIVETQTGEQINYYFIAIDEAEEYKIYATDINNNTFEIGEIGQYDFESDDSSVLIYNVPYEVYGNTIRIK